MIPSNAMSTHGLEPKWPSRCLYPNPSSKKRREPHCVYTPTTRYHRVCRLYRHRLRAGTRGGTVRSPRADVGGGRPWRATVDHLQLLVSNSFLLLLAWHLLLLASCCSLLEKFDYKRLNSHPWPPWPLLVLGSLSFFKHLLHGPVLNSLFGRTDRLFSTFFGI